MSNPSITADKTPWYQWDTGITVTLSGGEMTECHFANRKQGTAYVQAVINGVARVPDELLQVAAPIKAYGYVSDGAGGQTYVEQRFEVIARNIPADYTYTKTAQKTIRDAEVARDQAVQAAKDAKASELAADDSAVEASNSAQSAGESASAAATSASNAAKSAGDAAKSASDAKAAASKTVEDASELLKTYTDNAKTSADNAATSASNAADAASAASGSASAAAQSATDASNSKAAAQTAKAEAETAKSEAATSASNAAESATSAAESASDAAKTLTEAKQYTDANTSNALVGNVSGKLLHVEDAWPGKPLSLTIDGAYKQDGTPSPEAPVPITVIENPILKVTGRNLLDNDKGINNCFTKNADGTYTITKISDNERFSAYIPLRIPNGVNAYLSVTHMSAGVTGSVSVIFDYADGTQETSQLFSRDITAYFTEKDVRFIRFYVEGKVAIGESFTFLPQIEYGTEATLPITLPAEHPYLAALPDGTHDEIVIDKYGNASLTAIVGKTETAATDGVNATVGTDALSSTGAIADGATVYYKLAKPVIYPLGKLDIPSLPETISNVLTDAELTTNMSMTYKRDINTLLDRDKLPIASTTNRGTVKVGYGLDVDADGTLWVTESDSIPLAQTVTVRTSEKNFAVTGSPNDVASQKALMPVFNCGGYYSTFGGYFYLNLANSYKAGTKIHIELDVVWQDTHICSPIHRVAVVEIQQNTYTIPFGPSMYRDPDYNWYYWSFDVPVTADVPAKTQIHVNVF